MAQSSSGRSGRAPENPLAITLARSSIMARHLALRKLRTDAGGVTAHEVDLQLRQLVVRDGDVGELAEAGGDAVDHGMALDDAGDHGAGGEHPRARRTGQGHGLPPDRDGVHVGERQRTAVDFERSGRGHGGGSSDWR